MISENPFFSLGDTVFSENPVTAAPAVTGFSEKTGSLSEKNGLSENPVMVKQPVTMYGSSAEDPVTVRTLSY